MKAKEPIPYGLQEIDKQDIKAVSKVLQSDFTTGPFVKIRKGFCKFTKATFTTHAQTVLALHLACLAVGLERVGNSTFNNLSSNC